MPLFRKKPAAPASGAQPVSENDPIVAPGATKPTGPAEPGGQVPPVEPLMGDPDAHHFRAELAQGNWQEFHEFLDATRDWDDRFFYVNVLSDIEERPDWLAEWIAARPQSPLPLLFRGACGIRWAWHVRGGKYASRVKKEAWPVFRTLLVNADRDLAKAAELDLADPTPHARSVLCAIGLSLGVEEAGSPFGAATAIHRWHYGAHESMLQALTQKWLGSHAQMFEFARSVSTQAPEGRPVHTLLPRAHLEQWLWLARQPEDRKRQVRYFDDQVVRSEVRRAAGLSIDSPNYQAHKTTPSDRNVFAMCFWLMRDFESTLGQMQLIGPLIQRFPWAYRGDWPGI
jgi:hypothetical protein